MSKIYINYFFCIANVPLKLEQLGKSVFSELDGNPPMWITKKSPEEVYVNQAKVVFHLANYEHNNTYGKPQVRISKLLFNLKRCLLTFVCK